MPSTTNISRARRIRAMDFRASVAEGDEFRHQRIVIRRDHAIGMRRRIHANSRAPGVRNTVMRPAEGTNVSGSSALMRHSIAWPREHGLADDIFKLFPVGQANLRFDQVHARDHFRDRMLHLDAGVHFDEVDRAVFIHQEFDRAGAAVADLLERVDHLRAQLGALLRHRSPAKEIPR